MITTPQDKTIHEPLAYAVNLWGSHPDDNNDDCWTGWNFATFEEAEQKFNSLVKLAPHDSPYVELIGTDTYKCSRTSAPLHCNCFDCNPTSDNREYAMEQGMLHGIDAYNEAMGY